MLGVEDVSLSFNMAGGEARIKPTKFSKLRRFFRYKTKKAASLLKRLFLPCF